MHYTKIFPELADKEKPTFNSEMLRTARVSMLPPAKATWRNDVPKTFYFLKGYAVGKKYINMQKALVLSRRLHEGQKRKGGADYIVHPLRVCDYLVALQVEDDILLSSALLHDVVEDNEMVRANPEILIKEYAIDKEVLDVVMLLTKTKNMTKEQEVAYFEGIKRDWRALLIKLSDRVNNVSTLESFSVKKRIEYIIETEDYILPLCDEGKLLYPQLSNTITCVKYQITSLCDTVKILTTEYEVDKESLREATEKVKSEEIIQEVMKRKSDSRKVKADGNGDSSA